MRLACFVLAAGAIVSCVAGTGTKNPTPPLGDWRVYSSLETGVAIALPPEWQTFDLSAQREAVFERLVGEGTSASQAGSALGELASSGGRFVAVGPIPSGGAAFAYVLHTARPSRDSRPTFLARDKLPDGPCPPACTTCARAGTTR